MESPAEVAIRRSVADALVVFGRVLLQLDEGEAARAALAEAIDLAERHGLDTLAADGSGLLAKLAALVLRERRSISSVDLEGDQFCRPRGRSVLPTSRRSVTPDQPAGVEIEVEQGELATVGALAATPGLEPRCARTWQPACR